MESDGKAVKPDFALSCRALVPTRPCPRCQPSACQAVWDLRGTDNCWKSKFCNNSSKTQSSRREGSVTRVKNRRWLQLWHKAVRSLGDHTATCRATPAIHQLQSGAASVVFFSSDCLLLFQPITEYFAAMDSVSQVALHWCNKTSERCPVLEKFFWLSISAVLHSVGIFLSITIWSPKLRDQSQLSPQMGNFCYFHSKKIKANCNLFFVDKMSLGSFTFLLAFLPVDSMICTKLHSVDKNVLKCLSVSLTEWFAVRGLTKCMLSTEWNGAGAGKNILQTYGAGSYTLTWFVKNPAQSLSERILWDSDKTIVTLGKFSFAQIHLAVGKGIKKVNGCRAWPEIIASAVLLP